MAAWPTTTDLRNYLRLASIDATQAQLLLDLAKGTVKAEVGQDIDQVTDDTITLDGNGRSVLLLPQLPVISVGVLELDGEALVDVDDYTWTGDGILRKAVGDWGTTPRAIEVTYDHGYADDAIPEVARAAVLALAGAAYSNPGGLRSETIGSYSYTAEIAASAGIVMTDDVRRMLDPLRAS